MLLQSSRRASFLTKEASIAGKVGGGVAGAIGKGVGGTAGWLGKSIAKHPVGSLALLGGGAGAAFIGAEGIRRSEMGMDPRYLRAQTAGYVRQPQAQMPHARFYQALDRDPAGTAGRNVRNTRIFR